MDACGLYLRSCFIIILDFNFIIQFLPEFCPHDCKKLKAKIWRTVFLINGLPRGISGKNPPAMQDKEDPLEKEMATHCSILAWEIPWTEEPGRLQSMGSQRVRHDGASKQPPQQDMETTEMSISKWNDKDDVVYYSVKKKYKHIVSESHSVVSNVCKIMDCNLPGSSVHGILQARILEWVAISFSRGSSQSRDWTQISRISGRFFSSWAIRDTLKTVRQELPWWSSG